MDASVKLLRDSDRLLKKLDKVFPRERYLPPKEPLFNTSESEGNQRPFAYLDTLHYTGLPRPGKKARLTANAELPATTRAHTPLPVHLPEIPVKVEVA